MKTSSLEYLKGIKEIVVDRNRFVRGNPNRLEREQEVEKND